MTKDSISMANLDCDLFLLIDQNISSFYNLNLIKGFFLLSTKCLYIPKIDDYLAILTDEEMKDFVAINFSKYFKSIREEENLRKVSKLLGIFLTTPDEVKKICAIKLFY